MDGGAFYQRASLIAVEAWHQHIHENYRGAVAGNLLQSVKSVFRKDDLTAGLHEQNLGTAADGFAIVYDQHLDTGQANFGRVNGRRLR